MLQDIPAVYGSSHCTTQMPARKPQRLFIHYLWQINSEEGAVLVIWLRLCSAMI
ncbi:MAG: hypothetical protein HUU08_13855 [Candidatus Brocadia sp.]|nr:hypothetical protein [Candidatus Brocadia sp.]